MRKRIKEKCTTEEKQNSLHRYDFQLTTPDQIKDILSSFREVLVQEGYNHNLTPILHELIDKVNQRLIQSLNKKIPLGLLNGKMGLCIYLFYIGTECNNKLYVKLAEKYLNEIFKDLAQDSTINAKNELLEIALGIHFLIINKYVGGYIDDILEDVDNVLFRNLTFSTNKEINPLSLYDPSELMFILYYIYVRLKYIKKNSELDYLYKELAIKIINYVHMEFTNDSYNEPFIFSIYYQLPILLYVLSKIYSLNFYNLRLGKIFEEISERVLSTIPILHANRLYLLWGMAFIVHEYHSEPWSNHMHILRESISIDNILNRELKNKNVFFPDGISGIYFLLLSLEKNFSEYRINYDPKDFCEKIICSNIWDAYANTDTPNLNFPLSIVDGFPSLILTIHEILKNQEFKKSTYEN